MKDGKHITLAIESSCDETSVALVADGREVLSNIISSQIDIHKLYGGVVPEIASRHHLTNINAVTDEAFAAAGITPDEVDFKDTCSNMYLNELACRQMELLGVPMKRLGDAPHMGSSDLGDVSYECPAIQLNSSMGPPLRGDNYYSHTVEFAEMAGQPCAFDNAVIFIKGFVMTAIELMTEPAHLAAIKEEFARMER